MLRFGACVSSLVSTLNKFVETLPGTKQRFAVKAALDAWFREADRADWRTPADAKANYATASIVDGERNVLRVAAEPGGAAALAALITRGYQPKPGETRRRPRVRRESSTVDFGR